VSDKPPSDKEIIDALLDPLNMEIIEFLKTHEPFMIGLMRKHFTNPEVIDSIRKKFADTGEFQRMYEGQTISRSVRTNLPKTTPGLTYRMVELERLGLVTRLRYTKGNGKRDVKKNQHAKWHPYSADFYDKLQERRQELIKTAIWIRSFTNVTPTIQTAFEMDKAIRSAKLSKPEKVSELTKEQRANVGIILDGFDTLESTMKKRVLEWALESKYFENLEYT